jgi:DUF3102 family protein
MRSRRKRKTNSRAAHEENKRILAAQKEQKENERILAEHVEFILGVAERARRRTIEDIIAVGERLIDAQSRLDHGEWAGWLEKNFGWSDSTALNLMNVYRLVKSAEYESLNFKVLSITVSELYALARPSTPKEVKAKIIGRAKAGEYIGVGSVDDAKAALQPTPTETAKPQEEAPQITSSEVDGHERRGLWPTTNQTARRSPRRKRKMRIGGCETRGPGGLRSRSLRWISSRSTAIRRNLLTPLFCAKRCQSYRT